MTVPRIPLDIQAEAVRMSAINYRGALNRHEDLAKARRWNPDLLPSERIRADELDAAAETMTWLVNSQNPKAQQLRQGLENVA